MISQSSVSLFVTDLSHYILCRKLKEQGKKVKGGEEREVMIDVIGTDIETDIEGFVLGLFLLYCGGFILFFPFLSSPSSLNSKNNHGIGLVYSV